MTRDEARRRAVEAAAEAAYSRGQNLGPWLSLPTKMKEEWRNEMRAAIAAYERAMADAGWRMVRVPEELMPPDFPQPEISLGYDAGWNACRAAMLGDEP